MKINEQLNLVVPVRLDEDENPTLTAYHVPISRDVFEANYKILAATKAALASKGILYQMDAGPRIASLVLKDEAKESTEDANALLAEITRLTTILAPTAEGWDHLTVDTAIKRGVLDAEEWGETLSNIVFFTCHYALGRKAERKRIAEATVSLLNASITSLSLAEWTESLRASSATIHSTGPASSIPS